MSPQTTDRVLITQAEVTSGAFARGPRAFGWVEVFVAVQLLWGLLLFVPGAQPFRFYVRALPYVASLAALVVFLRFGVGERLPASSKWMLAVFGLLLLNLLHADTHTLAGVGQVVLQGAIAAPAFWVVRMVRNEKRLLAVLGALFVASLANAVVGILQVYAPARFLPPEFSAVGQALNPNYVEALTYLGADGSLIVRPPGLSDLPGGAAVSGLLTVVLGVGLAARTPSRRLRPLFAGSALVGMTVLYLTQVRSLSVMAVASLLAFAVLHARRGRLAQGGAVAAAGVAVVGLGFVWASTLAGDSLVERFAGLLETGLFRTFRETRGLFLDYTLHELLWQYPFGAGLGRWGMMQVYFGDPTMWQAPPIHAEIQLTGWLLDGGAVMWILYGAALAAAVRMSYALVVRGATEPLQQLATIALALQLVIIGLCFTGPVFNTQLGILFWAVTGAVWGAACGWQSQQDEVLRSGDSVEETDDLATHPDASGDVPPTCLAPGASSAA